MLSCPCPHRGRPTEFVNGEKKSRSDGCWEELFGSPIGGSSGDDEALDDSSRVLEYILLQETVSRGRPKPLCYEDILLMVVRHPILAQASTYPHVVPPGGMFYVVDCAPPGNWRGRRQSSSYIKPKPTIFFFSLTRKLIFCFITVIVSLAVHDGAFDEGMEEVRKQRRYSP